MHNFKSAPTFFADRDRRAAFQSLKNQKRTDAMADALQTNFALWGMIGCAAFKSVQFVQYLN